MDDKLFNELLESVQQMDAIRKGARRPARKTAYAPKDVQAIRGLTGLSQERFARLVGVPVGTLRNWEQGYRKPRGPAQALLRAIERDPKAVLKALAA
jgi:putative transcriptional regulator